MNSGEEILHKGDPGQKRVLWPRWMNGNESGRRKRNGKGEGRFILFISNQPLFFLQITQDIANTPSSSSFPLPHLPSRWRGRGCSKAPQLALMAELELWPGALTTRPDCLSLSLTRADEGPNQTRLKKTRLCFSRPVHTHISIIYMAAHLPMTTLAAN